MKQAATLRRPKSQPSASQTAQIVHINSTGRREKPHEWRIDEVRRASHARCGFLIGHHLSRALDQAIPEVFRDIRALEGGLRAGGRTLPQWLRAGFMRTHVASRVRPAIEGLYGTGQAALAAQFEAEFKAWEGRCDALAASCPRAMPRDAAARARLITSTVAEVEALLSSLISRIGHYAGAAGVSLQLGAGFGRLMKDLMAVK